MKIAMRRWLGVALGAASAGVLLGPAGHLSPLAPAQPAPLLVFAAASLKNALDAVNTQWQKESGRKVTISYAASSALARQIEQGAPAQIFVSADLDWMDYLASKALIRPDTRSDLLGNRLVVIAPKGQGSAIDLKPGVDLAKSLGNGRLAIANVEAVPAGKYGKAALVQLGTWDSVSNRTAQTENVRAALLLVSRAEAPLGIVYQTDAMADPNVEVIGIFPEDTHPPIVYPIALTTRSDGPDATAFLAYLRSDKAKRLFETHGFEAIQTGRS